MCMFIITVTLERGGFMNKAVEIYQDEARAGTFIISLGFEREHFRVLRLIEKHKKRFLRLEDKRLSKALIIRKVPAKTAGRPIKEYMLNKKQALFLGSIFRNSEKVLDFKERLAEEYVEQENLLKRIIHQHQDPLWIENRAAGKIVRRSETDTIKDFVKYATLQGSKNAKMYYTVLSKCVNDGLFDFNGRFKNKREAMNAVQLMDVAFADGIVSKTLFEGMEQSLPYKQIYKKVKERILILADIHGKSEVIQKNLEIEV